MNRYLYTGLMPSPKLDGGMVPIFYFLNASHTENAFRECLHKFYYDVKRVKMSMPRYEHCSLAPKQCITDMSLVIFRPALGKWNFCVLILKRYRGPISCRTRSEFQNIHPIFCYPLLPSISYQSLLSVLSALIFALPPQVLLMTNWLSGLVLQNSPCIARHGRNLCRLY